MSDLNMDLNEVVRQIRLIETQHATVKDENSNEVRVSGQEAIAYLVGGVIGMCLKLPAQGTSGAADYEERHASFVLAKLGQINEMHMIPITRARAIAKQIYVDRFNMVHRPTLDVSVISNRIAATVGENDTTLLPLRYLHKKANENDSEFKRTVRLLGFSLVNDNPFVDA